MLELLGRYELVRKLATGGMADIFVARQWGDGGFCRPAIVKRLHAHLAEQPMVLSDFRNEAHLLSMLTHPSIPHVYDFRHDAGCWYLAMELLHGPTTGDVMRSVAGPVPWEVTVAIGLELLDALCFVHERHDDRTGEPLGIVHGDLSPENVVLGRDGVVKLLDFGIAGDRAHRAQRRAQAGGLRGTHGYMAPEVVDHKQPVDGRADLFVAAVLLYELMTGTRLYPGHGPSFVNALLEQRPAPPSDRVSSIPADLDRVVLGLLARDVHDRPTSARQAYAELARVAAGHGCDTGLPVVAAYAEQVAPSSEDLHLPPAPRPPQLELRDIPSIPPATVGGFESSGTLSDEEHRDLVSDIEDLFSPAAALGERPSGASGPDAAVEPVGDVSLSVSAPEAHSRVQAGDDGGDSSGFYIYVADDD